MSGGGELLYSAGSSEGDGGLARAAAQLAALRELSDSWTVELDLRTTKAGDERGPGLRQAHLVCTRDRQSVFCLAKDLDSGVYVFTVAGLAGAVARHFREVHCDGGGNPL